jgi:hypothetical protein
MTKDWIVRLVQAAAITVAITAVCQEMEKPPEEREWHGRVCFVPYDFRFPTLSRLRDAFWNRESGHIFSPQPLGVGWTINFHALLGKIWLLGESCLSEDDFLMPTPSLKKALEDRPTTAQDAVSSV